MWFDTITVLWFDYSYNLSSSPALLVCALEMSKAGALDLASGLGGKIEKDDVLSAVDKYVLWFD